MGADNENGGQNENANAGAGGDAGQGQGGQPPPNQGQSMETVVAELKALKAQNAQYAQAFATQQQQIQQLSASRQPQRQEEDEEELDPTVKRHIEKERSSTRQELAQLRDSMDHQTFMNVVASMGVDVETASQALAVHQNWMKSGFRNKNGEPPSRVDALRYLRGMQLEQQSGDRRKDGKNAEDLRRAENESGGVERSGKRGGGGGGGGAPDLSKMSRKERLEKGWSSVLDAEGF